jgi:hypothetical protein
MGILMDIFNEILDKKAYHKVWKMATACPVSKNRGKVGQPNIYRGVSLPQVVGTIFFQVSE